MGRNNRLRPVINNQQQHESELGTEVQLTAPSVYLNAIKRYVGSELDSGCCSLKPRCYLNVPARKILVIYEGSRNGRPSQSLTPT